MPTRISRVARSYRTQNKFRKC